MEKNADPVSVMVVEDDAELRDRVLVPGLRQAGFAAEGVDSALALYRALNRRVSDLFVVDIGLPDESGFAVVRHLRELGRSGIVVLTGRDGTVDHVQGLDYGADAYLAKPMAVPVLAATLRSVWRHIAPSGEPGVTAPMSVPPPTGDSGWRLDSSGWQLVSPAQERVTLSKAEMQLLARLAGVAGEVVEREAILLVLGEREAEFDPHRLEMLVHRLRRKVQIATGMDLPLVTVRGVGYLLAI